MARARNDASFDDDASSPSMAGERRCVCGAEAGQTGTGVCLAKGGCV